MKKINLLLLIIATVNASITAQENWKKKNDSIKEKVVQFFNIQQTDSLYNLAGVAFKKQLSAGQFKNVCENNLYPLGKIKTAEFEKFDTLQRVSKYKASFETGVFSLYISLDSLSKLQAFLFKPYKAEPDAKTTKAASDNALVSDLDKALDKIVQPFMGNSKTVGLSIGIFKNGKTWFYNYGEVRKGSNQLPSSKSLYEIGSITKTFTGILLAKAVIEKKISLNDPINKYLPKSTAALRFDNEDAKIVHLANHTSGLPRLPDNFTDIASTNPYKNYEEEQLLAVLSNAKLLNKPGDKLSYSNFGVGLLGYILEKATKKTYEQQVISFITSSLGMTNTKQFLVKGDSSYFVQGYDENIAAASQWDFKALAAAGALRSNAEDMLKYAAANAVFNFDTSKHATLKKAITLSHQPTFTKDLTQKIGLNWFIQTWNGSKILFHGGQTGGYKSFLSINPVTKTAIIILANTAVINDSMGVELQQYIDK